jgi:stage IV sporulation protein FB
VFDIDVRVHWSFLLVLVYGAFVFGGGSGGVMAGALYGVLVTLLLFVCVTLHEFGHALVAKYYKVNVSSITLLPIGGVANLERIPDKPLQELLITVAGPLVNFVIALILLPITFLVLSLEGGARTFSGNLDQLIVRFQQPGLGNLLIYLLGANVMLGLFNLLPAFPMDGGRILRALLAMAMPYVQATRIAVLVGRVMAVLLAIWGIMGGGIALLLIAFFVYVGGGAEREAVESRAVLKYVTASQALTRGAANLYSSERLSRAVDLIMNTYQSDFPVLDLGGKFIGVLTRPQLVQALRSEGPDARIVDVMIPAEAVPVTAPTATLDDVWDKMATGGARVVAVKRQNEFLGLITLEDINEVFHVIGASMSRSGQPPAGGATRTPVPADAERGASVDA